MKPAELIEGLSRADAYPFPVERVEVRQTHISVVFRAGERAYKVKKPVTFPFLDYGTPELRKHYCHEEVRLNRRWAPDVYLGVTPIVERGGRLRVGGEGAVVEHAVEMRRLPDEASLGSLLLEGRVDRALVEELGRRVAGFHETAGRTGPAGAFGQVARNLRENLEVSGPGPPLLARLLRRVESELARLRARIDARPVCETHGDLRLEHVYRFPDRRPPADLIAIDGIEFNERFRRIDPVSDMAFLRTDLVAHGRRDLAEAFTESYFRASGDEAGRELLALYSSYRAAVRAKVQALKSREEEIGEEERERAERRSRRWWLLALSEIEAPGRRPCLALTAGLPGTGKTTLARALAQEAGFELIRSDIVRKEGGGRGDLYGPEQVRETYTECLRRAEAIVLEGGRALVDATFRAEEERLRFQRAAEACGVPFLIFHCTLRAEAARARLAARRGDASDADPAVHDELARRWEPFGSGTLPRVREIDSSLPPSASAARALDALRAEGLLGVP